MVPQSYYRCWVEVNLDALRQNVRAIRQRLRLGTRVIAVVKADAYGHGLAPVTGVLMQSGVDGFAVANLHEALAVRQLGGRGWPLLLLGAALPFEVPKIVEQEIIPTISSLEEAHWLEAEAARQQKQLGIHVEVDTGMGRVGFWHEQALDAIREVAALPHLRLAGIYTHFPCADTDVPETQREFDTFLRLTTQLSMLGLELGWKHAANSAALLHLPATQLDAVRPGLLLYGIPPTASDPAAADFLPVLSFKARIAYVKEVAAGRTISYGQTFRAPAPMKVATVAAGYADGFARSLSNRAEVLVGGRRCRLVGRVTMDQIMVDVTAVPRVAGGDEAVFIGRQVSATEPGVGGAISATEVADWEQTIAWEVLCGLTKTARVPRIYHGAAAA